MKKISDNKHPASKKSSTGTSEEQSSVAKSKLFKKSVEVPKGLTISPVPSKVSSKSPEPSRVSSKSPELSKVSSKSPEPSRVSSKSPPLLTIFSNFGRRCSVSEGNPSTSKSPPLSERIAKFKRRFSESDGSLSAAKSSLMNRFNKSKRHFSEGACHFSPHRPILSSECSQKNPTKIPSPRLSPIRHYNPLIKIDRIDFSTLGEEILIPAYMNSRSCYSVMPVSGKVVVLSVELLVKNAFSALLVNDLRSAPLWSIKDFAYVGLLTISDFINVLRHYYYSDPEDIKDIENQKIATWRELTCNDRPFVKVNSMESLAKATKLLIEEKVHRIPVIDEKRQCVVHVLTKKRVLQYLYSKFIENFDRTKVKTPSFFSKSIEELGVGTFTNIAKVTPKTRVIEALDLFVERKVSALPIVDENDVFIDVFGKIDVFALAKAQTYHNLDMTVNEAIDRAGIHEDVYGCASNETLGSVIDKFVLSKARRLVVLDGKKSPAGIVSLSDVLKFLVVQPIALHSQSHHAHLISLEQLSSPSTDVIDETPEGAVGGESNVFLDSEDSNLTPGPSKSSDLTDESIVEELSNLQIEEDAALPPTVSDDELQ